jgi:hypothetical protein
MTIEAAPRTWATSYAPGNAATRLRQAERFVVWVKHLMIKKRGRSLHAGQAAQ